VAKFLGNSRRTEADTPDMTWWVFDSESGVLGLDRFALELHWRLVGEQTLAWWTNTSGRMLGFAQVGVA